MGLELGWQLSECTRAVASWPGLVSGGAGQSAPFLREGYSAEGRFEEARPMGGISSDIAHRANLWHLRRPG